MTIPKGGRGLRAQHPTSTVRVPKDIICSVNILSSFYRETSSDLLEILVGNLILAKHKSKETRDWVELNRLIEAIESELPADHLVALEASFPTAPQRVDIKT